MAKKLHCDKKRSEVAFATQSRFFAVFSFDKHTARYDFWNGSHSGKISSKTLHYQNKHEAYEKRKIKLHFANVFAFQHRRINRDKYRVKPFSSDSSM